MENMLKIKIEDKEYLISKQEKDKLLELKAKMIDTDNYIDIANYYNFIKQIKQNNQKI